MGMAESRWLSSEEQETWISFLVATRLLWSQLERDLQRELHLPRTYYEILSTLSETPGHTLSLSHLAALLQLSPSRLSHAVSRLEETGWIRREMSAVDRRKWSAVLTDEGMAMLCAAAPVHVESLRTHLLDHLTPSQVEQLGEISRALLAHLAPGLDVAQAFARSKEGNQAGVECVNGLSTMQNLAGDASTPACRIHGQTDTPDQSEETAVSGASRSP
jgi:DNA-binding MarR family transcriptional regulator